MSGLRLYFRYARINVREGLQYKGWIFGMIVTLLFTVTDPFEALLMLGRFGAIGGVTPARILLVYAVAVMCFGLAELFVRGMDAFPNIVRAGRFDRLLVRPRSLFLQVLGERFHISRLSRIAGMAILAVIAYHADAAARPEGWAFPLGGAAALAMVLCAVLGGLLTYAGVFSLISAPSFFTIEQMEWIYIFTNGSYQVAKVPYAHLPGWLRGMFLYVMPMFVFCYFPFAAALGWDATPPWLGWAALPAGAAYCALGVGVWSYCARFYKSTGN